MHGKDDDFHETCTCKFCRLHVTNAETDDVNDDVSCVKEVTYVGDSNDCVSDVYSDHDDDKESDVSGGDYSDGEYDISVGRHVSTRVIGQNTGHVYVFSDNENDGDVDSSDDDGDVYIDAVDRTYV